MSNEKNTNEGNQPDAAIVTARLLGVRPNVFTLFFLFQGEFWELEFEGNLRPDYIFVDLPPQKRIRVFLNDLYKEVPCDYNGKVHLISSYRN